jgi:hypothetical protein
MRHLVNLMVCGVLSLGFLASSALRAAPADGRANAPPWVIGNGQLDAGLYMPREVQQAYAKGARSADGRPGPNYWQNHAEHCIRITLSPPAGHGHGWQDDGRAGAQPWSMRPKASKPGIVIGSFAAL